MNKSYIAAILSVSSLEFSNGSMAKKMSKPEYKVKERHIKPVCKSVQDVYMDRAIKHYDQ